tara:strand:- start:81 stop:446 length:366 start_codon:yes stop_codon:yes gene_type:complete
MARRSQRLRRKRRIEKAKTKEQEAKITKVVEDNSVVLERMKHASSTCDKILQKLDSIKKEPETVSQIIEPQFLSLEPPPELEEGNQEEEKVEVVSKEPVKPKAKRTTRRRKTTTKKKTSEE